jgi:hypothetical protein
MSEKPIISPTAVERLIAAYEARGHLVKTGFDTAKDLRALLASEGAERPTAKTARIGRYLADMVIRHYNVAAREVERAAAAKDYATVVKEEHSAQVLAVLAIQACRVIDKSTEEALYTAPPPSDAPPPTEERER